MAHFANKPSDFNVSLEKHIKKSHQLNKAWTPLFHVKIQLVRVPRHFLPLIPHLTEDFMRLTLLLLLGAVAAQAQISHFKHVVVIFQENRTRTIFFKACAPLPMEPVQYLRLLALRHSNLELGDNQGREDSALPGCVGQHLRSESLAQVVQLDVRRCHRQPSNMPDGRCPNRLRCRAGHHLPDKPAVQVCRQFDWDSEPLSHARDRVRLGKLYVSNQSGAEFPGASFLGGRHDSRRCWSGLHCSTHDGRRTGFP
jgi:hypothetical protein